MLICVLHEFLHAPVILLPILPRDAQEIYINQRWNSHQLSIHSSQLDSPRQKLRQRFPRNHLGQIDNGTLLCQHIQVVAIDEQHIRTLPVGQIRQHACSEFLFLISRTILDRQLAVFCLEGSHRIAHHIVIPVVVQIVDADLSRMKG